MKKEVMKEKIEYREHPVHLYPAYKVRPLPYEIQSGELDMERKENEVNG